MRVRATPKFLKQAEKNMTPEMLQQLVDTLAIAPEKVVLIRGTSGIRKVRWSTGKNNKGKSSGVRILYYYEKNKVIILLISLFAKADKENIDETEKAELRKLLPELLRRYCDE